MTRARVAIGFLSEQPLHDFFQAAAERRETGHVDLLDVDSPVADHLAKLLSRRKVAKPPFQFALQWMCGVTAAGAILKGDTTLIRILFQCAQYPCLDCRLGNHGDAPRETLFLESIQYGLSLLFPGSTTCCCRVRVSKQDSHHIVPQLAFPFCGDPGESPCVVEEVTGFRRSLLSRQAEGLLGCLQFGRALLEGVPRYESVASGSQRRVLVSCFNNLIHSDGHRSMTVFVSLADRRVTHTETEVRWTFAAEQEVHLTSPP